MTTLPGSLAANPFLDTWIRVDPADTITVFTGKVELGQGVLAAIGRIAADQLDVRLDRIRVLSRPAATIGPVEPLTVGSNVDGAERNSGPTGCRGCEGGGAEAWRRCGSTRPRRHYG